MATTIKGMKIKVSHKLGIAMTKPIVTVEPAATPKIVRMLSLSSFTVLRRAPERAAIKQPLIGPNNQGSGRWSQRKITAPAKPMQWVAMCLAINLQGF